MRERLVLVATDGVRIATDFLIARHPVTLAEYREIIDGLPADADSETLIQRATWSEAIRYCNRLSLECGLPPCYDEPSGAMIDRDGRRGDEVPSIGGTERPIDRVHGFRLPTAAEWEYAAKGWGPAGRSGSYLPRLRETFRPWDVDPVRYRDGYSRLEELVPNGLGICGVLGNAREWCRDTETSCGLKNTACFWQEYIANYNNDLSYRVETEIRGDDDALAFRVVLTASVGSRIGPR